MTRLRAPRSAPTAAVRRARDHGDRARLGVLPGSTATPAVARARARRAGARSARTPSPRRSRALPYLEAVCHETLRPPPARRRTSFACSARRSSSGLRRCRPASRSSAVIDAAPRARRALPRARRVPARALPRAEVRAARVPPVRRRRPPLHRRRVRDLRAEARARDVAGPHPLHARRAQPERPVMRNLAMGPKGRVRVTASPRRP